MIYIHKDINFWKTKVKLPDSYLISTDIDDYEVGAYLPLSEEQEQYHNEHPDATPVGVLAHAARSGTRTDTGRTALACP